jgi:hypothetical protein
MCLIILESQKITTILIYEYVSTSNEKEIYQKNYFVSVMVIQNSVLRVILVQDIPFVTPTLIAPT